MQSASCVIIHAVSDLNTWQNIDKASDFFLEYKKILHQVEADLVSAYKNSLQKIGIPANAPSSGKPPLSEGDLRSRILVMQQNGVLEGDTELLQKTYRAAFTETIERYGLKTQWAKCLQEMFDFFSKLPAFRQSSGAAYRLPTEPPPTGECCDDVINDLKEQLAERTSIGRDWHWLSDYLPRNLTRFPADRLIVDEPRGMIDHVLKNRHANELLQLHDDEKEVPSDIFKGWHTKKVFVCFFLGHGTVEENCHFFWHQQKINGEDSEKNAILADLLEKKEVKVEEKNGEEVKSVSGKTVQKYWQKWWELVKKTEMPDSHLIIVADTNCSGQIVDDLRKWDESSRVDLERFGCSITVQASCGSGELARSGYFAPTWVLLNQHLFGKIDSRPEKIDKNCCQEILPGSLLQHPDYHTVGSLNKQIKLLTRENAQFTFWQWKCNFPEKIGDSTSFFQSRARPSYDECQKIINSGNYSIDEFKFFVADGRREDGRQLQIVAFVKKHPKDQGGKTAVEFSQYFHVNLESLTGNWTYPKPAGSSYCIHAAENSIPQPHWTLADDGFGHPDVEKFKLEKDETAVILPPFSHFLDKLGDDLKEFGSLESGRFGDFGSINWFRVKDCQLETALKRLSAREGASGVWFFPVKQIYYEGRPLITVGNGKKFQKEDQDLLSKNGALKTFLEKLFELIEKNADSKVLLPPNSASPNGRKILLKDWCSALELKCSAVNEKLPGVLKQINNLSNTRLNGGPCPCGSNKKVDEKMLAEQMAAERKEKLAERDSILADIERHWQMWASVPNGIYQTRYPPDLL